MRKGVAILIGAVAAVSILGLTTGGFPSRPTLQRIFFSQGAAFDAYSICNQGAAANNKCWVVRLGGSNDIQIDTGDDNGNALGGHSVIDAGRSAAAVTTVAIGNGTDNPTITLNGASLPVSTAPVICSATCSAATIAVGQTYIIQKPSDTSRASTVTLTNDPDLVFTAVPIGKYYVNQFSVQFNSANADSAQGIQIGFTCGGTCAPQPTTPAAQCLSSNSVAVTACVGSGSYQWPQSPAIVVNDASSGEKTIIGAQVQILNVTVAGSIGISWAQQASNASGTIVRANSYLSVTRLN